MKKFFGLVLLIITFLYASCSSTSVASDGKLGSASIPTVPDGYMLIEKPDINFPDNEPIKLQSPNFSDSKVPYPLPFNYLFWYEDENKWINERSDSRTRFSFRNGFLEAGLVAGLIAVEINSLIPNSFDEPYRSIFYNDVKNNFWKCYELNSHGRIIQPTSRIFSLARKIKEANSAIGKTDSFAYSLTDKGAISIVSYLGDSVENLVIPEKIEGITVTTIGSFYSPSNATVKKLTIPKTVELIQNGAFSECGIETLVFEKNSNLKEIGDSAFYNNKIKDYTIPSSIEYIGCKAFYGNKIEEVKLPHKKIRLRYKCFDSNKIKQLVFLSTWEIFEGGGIPVDFIHSDELEEIYFEDGCLKINREAFSNCKNLKKISIPASMREIDEYAFENCSSLTEIVMRGDVHFKYTASHCFSGCPLSLQTKSRLLKSGGSSQSFD